MGFDLDLTLADTRQGIAATYDAISAESGVKIDTADVLARLGIPLEYELRHWVSEAEVPEFADRFRELYLPIAVPETVAMPGALEAIAAVRSHAGRAIVVTGKNQRAAEETVRFLGLDVVCVAGGRFGAGKADVLREYGTRAFVGDHVADVDAARVGGATSVAVATGPFDAAALREYGADVVLPDLGAFPAWLDDE